MYTRFHLVGTGRLSEVTGGEPSKLGKAWRCVTCDPPDISIARVSSKWQAYEGCWIRTNLAFRTRPEMRNTGLKIRVWRAAYTTALRLAASRNQRALSFGIRFCVLKSTYTIPNRVP